jgi:hypothetical protein
MRTGAVIAHTRKHDRTMREDHPNGLPGGLAQEMPYKHVGKFHTATDY